MVGNRDLSQGSHHRRAIHRDRMRGERLRRANGPDFPDTSRTKIGLLIVPLPGCLRSRRYWRAKWMEVVMSDLRIITLTAGLLGACALAAHADAADTAKHTAPDF